MRLTTVIRANIFMFIAMIFYWNLTMQQSDMAIIIIHFSGATDMKHKFIVRQINKRWVVDEKYYGFADEAIWYSDSI